ncbi:MAG: hypothetical protein ACRDN0_40690, partial [Trebonia sp.]
VEGSAGQARFREPSAREREKLAKASRAQRARDEKRLEELRKETAKQARKVNKRASRDQREARGQRRRHRQPLWGIAAVILFGAIVFAYSRFVHSPASSAGGPNDTKVVTNGAVPPTTAASATPPVSPLTESGPPSDPFQNTPADKWPNGSAGIVVPAAKPVGGYSASQVEYAYETTKKLLTAAALNKQTLLGGAPTAFADLLTTQEHASFVGDLDKIGVDKSSRGYVMSFAPGTTKLIGSAIKVHGSMEARAATDKGDPVLDVDVNYLVTYAVEPPHAPADWMRVVAHFDGPVEFGSWAQATTSFTPWWEPAIFVAGERCSSRDGFVHPDYTTGPADSVRPSGHPIDPYSSKEPPKGCTATTGT